MLLWRRTNLLIKILPNIFMVFWGTLVHLDCCSPVKKWGYRNMLSATGAIAEPVWLEK
jgi:hypothetical protein